jgi:hypothetical protein
MYILHRTAHDLKTFLLSVIFALLFVAVKERTVVCAKAYLSAQDKYLQQRQEVYMLLSLISSFKPGPTVCSVIVSARIRHEAASSLSIQVNGVAPSNIVASRQTWRPSLRLDRRRNISKSLRIFDLLFYRRQFWRIWL